MELALYEAGARMPKKIIEAMMRHLDQFGCEVPFFYSGIEVEICQEALTEVCRRKNLNAEFSKEMNLPVIRFCPC